MNCEICNEYNCDSSECIFLYKLSIGEFELYFPKVKKRKLER